MTKECRNCKYLGREFKHIKGYNNVEEWRDCTFPKPWHLTSVAVPMVKEAGKDCKCFEAISTNKEVIKITEGARSNAAK